MCSSDLCGSGLEAVNQAGRAVETDHGDLFVAGGVESMKLHDIYLELPSEQIAYVKFIFESYEDVGIIRTVDRKKAIIVLLAMDDFLDSARAILSSLEKEIPLRQISRPASISDDWLMAELALELTTR